MKILCAGMMVCDLLLSPIPDDILERDSVRIGKPVISCGGDALNAAVSLSKLGEDVTIAGRIAEDTNGSFIRGVCRDNRISQAGVTIDKEYPTAVSFALIDKTGERHFLSNKDIFVSFCSQDVSDELIRKNDIIYLGSAMSFPQMDGKGIHDLFSRARKYGKLTAMDAAVDEDIQPDDWLEDLRPALSETDIFFPSYAEASVITGLDKPEAIADKFRSTGVKIFGIKLGAEGCYVTDFKTEKRIPGIPNVKVVDTTGAGDSFFAGFLCGISHQMDPFESAAFASVVAAKNIEKIGGTAGVPNFDEAMCAYQNLFHQKKFL